MKLGTIGTFARSCTHNNPSAWSKRLPVVILALIACVIACYLAAYQLEIITTVWEPFFGEGSRRILKESSFSHLLPVPDAVSGAVVYLVEVVLECIGGEYRWQTRPIVVFVTGIVTGALALTAIILVLSQIFWFRSFCTLCLLSALCSLMIAGLVLPELWASIKCR